MAGEPLTETERIAAWRLLALLDAGFALEVAQKLAARASGPERVDVHEACDLVRRGCSPAVAAAILL